MGGDTLQQFVTYSNPATATTALVGGTFKKNLETTQGARRAQDRLEAERRAQLENEAAIREAAAARAATSGQRAGARSTILSATGFGSGNTRQGLSMGTLFGN